MPNLFQTVRIQLLNHQLIGPVIRGPIIILSDDATNPSRYSTMVVRESDGLLLEHRAALTQSDIVDLIEEWADKEPW
jgi:hypothetical protein